MGAWEIRQFELAVGYSATDIVGYLFLDVFFYHLQIDQTGGKYHQDDHQEDKNQQAFDQPAEYFNAFAHRGVFQIPIQAGPDRIDAQPTRIDKGA
jgi:hypothetical protein